MQSCELKASSTCSGRIAKVNRFVVGFAKMVSGTKRFNFPLPRHLLASYEVAEVLEDFASHPSS